MQVEWILIKFRLQVDFIILIFLLSPFNSSFLLIVFADKTQRVRLIINHLVLCLLPLLLYLIVQKEYEHYLYSSHILQFQLASKVDCLN